MLIKFIKLVWANFIWILRKNFLVLKNLKSAISDNPFQKYLGHRNCRTSVHMFQANTMKIVTPPLPPPQSMLCFQYTHHDTRKPNAEHDPTLNRGRGGIAFWNKMYIGGICPNSFESDCLNPYSYVLII